MQFPDGEIRVTAGPAAPVTIIYASLDRPNEKLIALTFAAEALRRGGAKRLVLLAPYLCYMRQDTAFHEGEAISQKVIGPLHRRMRGPRDHRRCASAPHARHRDRISGDRNPIICRRCRQSQTRCGRAGLDPATVVVRTGCGIAALGQRSRRPARPLLYRRAKDPTRRPLRRNRLSGPDMHCRPSRFDRGRYRLLGRHHDRLRQGADVGRRDNDRRRRHARAVPGTALPRHGSSGIRSIRSTHSVPHSTNAIALDNLFIDALQDEMTFATIPETSR